MKKITLLILVIMSLLMMNACKPKESKQVAKEEKDTFTYLVDKFADLKILRYKVPGFEELSLNQKLLVYYLSQAALYGQEITWDQNYKHNLCIKRTLEAIMENYNGDRTSPDFEKFMVYTKRVWFSKGIHHHYSKDKFLPEFSEDYFKQLVMNSPNANFPLEPGEKVEDLLKKLIPILFDPTIAPKGVSQDSEKDLITNSASNFYENVTEKEARTFYDAMRDEKDTTPISYGLNSKLVKEKGKVIEKTYKIGGMYSPALEKMVFWLEKALTVAENDAQKNHIKKLIEYFHNGDLLTWDDYNILWVQDNESMIDYVLGFIEDYDDPLGMKATFEGVINFKDMEGTKRTQIISANAQWFENNSPVDPRFKKKEVKGVTAKVITTAQLSGDAFPSTPIGINLPNADWIRKQYGSKSVTMDNITWAYDRSSVGNGFLEEFCFSDEERKRVEQYSYLAGNLTTDLHECLGHGSGQLLPGVSSNALSNYQSVLEETRADLYALYYIMDPKMVELDLMPSLDVAKVEYDNYIRNGMMTQLTRIQPGKNIEQAHMRNRALIAHWVYEKGMAEKVIEKKIKDGKTYFVVNNYDKLRGLFGDLLKEVQRIKSEGDYEAGKKLVETYGVKVDPVLHKEVLERYAKLNLAPYSGFINPVYTLVTKDNKIVDVKVEYPMDFAKQMMEYSKTYRVLPTYN